MGEICCNIADSVQLSKACSNALSRLGGVDVCIINAAIRRFAPIENMSDKDWDESFAVNLSSVFRLTRQLIPALRDSRGSLVILGSNSGTHFFEGGAAYCTTKAALKALVEVIILETQPQGIRTTLVTPGAIRNRPKEHDDKKIQPETIGKIIYDMVHCNSDALVAEIDIRPARARPFPIMGIERLQYL